jgi:hypothetical protein
MKRQIHGLRQLKAIFIYWEGIILFLSYLAIRAGEQCGFYGYYHPGKMPGHTFELPVQIKRDVGV